MGCALEQEVCRLTPTHSQPGNTQCIGDNGYILLWSVDSGTLEQRIKTMQGPITALKWLHNKEDDGHLFLASAGADGTLHLWSIFSNFVCFFIDHSFSHHTIYLQYSKQARFYACTRFSRGL